MKTKTKYIYMFGAVGSGKTMASKKISKLYNYEHIELDRLLYIFDSNGTIVNKPKEKLEENIRKIFLANQNTIFEDVGSQQMFYIYEKIDLFIFLDVNFFIRSYRIIKRLCKRLFLVEEYGFDKDLSLKNKIFFSLKLICLSSKFEKKYKKQIFDEIKKNNKKIVILRKRKDIEKFILNNSL